MAEKTELQRVLTDGMLCRDLQEVMLLFREGGIDLWEEVLDLICMSERDPSQDFVLLEVGCGSGACLEQLLRNLLQKFSFRRGRVKAIGIDKNPLPEMIPKRTLGIDPSVLSSLSFYFAQQNVEEIPSTPLAELRRGDVCALDLPDASVNVGYSVATLIYVADTLRALSEVFRVLKPGGKFFWEICAKDISFFPDFDKILDVTPGARRVFKYVEAGDDIGMGFVICEKVSDSGFEGFGYEFVREILPVLNVYESDGQTPRAFYRNAIYRVLPVMDASVGEGKPTRRVDRPFGQRFEQFLERVLRDAEFARFPIRYRRRDRERVNQFPVRLNVMFQAGDIDGLRKELQGIVRVLMSAE